MSPGYLPFAGALDLPAFFCDNCGFWQRHFEAPPACPLCLDARHVVPQTGWSFRTLAEAQALYPCHWEELEPGLWRFWNEPVSGIGSMSYLLQGPAGNLMFEGCAAFSPEALAFIADLGGVQVLAASHPHSYGALWQVQDRFDPELALHPGDLAWSGAVCVTWPFDAVLEPLPGLELHLTAGHFDGHTVLYDRGRRILFCGDALKFELDPADRRRATTISTHKAFVRGIPMTPNELRRYRDVFAPLDFRQTFTPFEQVTNSGRREALALIDSMLASRPHARPAPLAELPRAEPMRG
ncbi:MBL fold metallo-hydrolase [Lichenibacterium ramalinae]|uniref:Metallo-beta-lactamase domain-containing protein n=1 Tax=Lichenibacterium ramalinae TaxID=2316527 RepID=A0A4Q2R9Y0_9HYPH|nr:MBL fold metallo-hydrolase [Lichenibacterium ramalinae]RYB02799.1 hypothetical protein D3272_19020 [Lichenibacterium ramalinae]